MSKLWGSIRLNWWFNKKFIKKIAWSKIVKKMLKLSWFVGSNIKFTKWDSNFKTKD